MGASNSNTDIGKQKIQPPKKSLCKVKTEKGTSIGFFCRIPNPVLIIRSDVLNEKEINSVKKITLSFNDEKSFTEIIIDKNRKIFTIEKTDDGIEINVSIIEIKPKEDKLQNQEFLEPDSNLIKNDIRYTSKNIYLMYYKKNEKIMFEKGIVKQVKKNKYEIEHNANPKIDSVGCPILLFNNKVIAVQGKITPSDEFSQGILLSFLINNYKKKYGSKNENNCNEEDEKKTANKNDNGKLQIKGNEILRNKKSIISFGSGESILDVMNKRLCKIYKANGKFGSGFFCRIPRIPSFEKFNLLTVLVTSNSVLDENSIKNGQEIKFSLKNGSIKKTIIIDSERKIYTNKDLDVSIVEIKSNDGISSYLDINEKLFNPTEEVYYKDKQILLIHYPGGGKFSYSSGFIEAVDKNNIKHSCDNKEGSLGGAILDLDYKVIGIHTKGKDSISNIGTKIIVPIKEFINKFYANNINDEDNIKNECKESIKQNEVIVIKNKKEEDEKKKGNINIVENEKNEIIIKVEIKEEDIDHKIDFLGLNNALYFLEKQKKSNKNAKNLINDIKKILSVLNKKNVILFINNNDKEKDFQSYFIPKKLGTYTIKLIFKIKLECCIYMFWACYNLIDIDLSNFNTQNVTNMKSMFCYCKNLTNINLSNMNTQNVTNMSEMFGECNNLININLTNFNTNNVTDMNSMFYNCNNLSSLDLSNFNTQNVEDMLAMFGECNRLTIINLSNFNTQNVTNMSAMFGGCKNLTSINLSSFDTQNLKDMSTMFYNCNKLSILDLSNFSTQNVINMYGMFFGCNSLTSIDLSNFNTQKVINMKSMFCSCNNLSSINLSNFNTREVTSMNSMFGECENLNSINLSHFNTPNLKDITAMFARCKNVTKINLSNFNFQNVSDMNNMLGDCDNLTNIIVKDELSKEKIMKISPLSVKITIGFFN